jgi:hypothetical protein
MSNTLFGTFASLALLLSVACANRAEVELDLERTGVTSTFTFHACPSGWSDLTNDCQGPAYPFEKSGDPSHAEIGLYIESDITGLELHLDQDGLTPRCQILPLDLSAGSVRATIRIQSDSIQVEGCSSCGALRTSCAPMM